MKFFVVFAIICGSIGFSEQGMPKEQRMEMYKKLANECAAKEGASAADVDEALAHKLPSTQGGKCLHACMAETMGLIKDNKSNLEGSIALAKSAFGDDEAKIKVLTEMITECAAITDADRCEAAAKLCECGDKAAKARGIAFGDW